MISFSEELFKKVPVVGILRGYPLKTVLKIGEIYAEAGYTNLEITLNTPNALEIIQKTNHTFQGTLNIGAGTVLSMEAVAEVLDAGGQFIVSPVVDAQVITYCVDRKIPIFPGALTPTEIYNAARLGARMVKVFPGAAFDPNYIADVLAPLNQLELMPTGGVTLENLEAFVKAGAKAFGMGGNLFKNELIQNEDWNGLKDHFLTFKETLIKSLNP